MAKRTQRVVERSVTGNEVDPSASSADDHHLVLFQVAEDTFAFRLEAIAEIIRLPPLAHMPLAPHSLLGLANRRGAVLPVVSTRRLLKLPDQTHGDETRVIVVGQDSPVGFAVDSVTQLRTVPGSLVENSKTEAGSEDSGFVEGSLKGGEGQSTVKLLNPQAMLRGDFATLGAAVSRQSKAAVAASAGPSHARIDSGSAVSLVSFELARQEYALPLNGVREIIPMPAHISAVARAEAAVLGVITLRDRLLPMVSLRALLGLEADANERGGKVVVLAMGQTAVGVVVDRTREILHVERADMDPAPALLTRGAGDAEITAICRLDGGKRLVAVLSPERLFRSEVVTRVLAEHGPAAETTSAELDELAMMDEQFVVFRLGAQEYGLPIEAVAEIARPPEHITALPKAPAFIDGVINLRGDVVPIIDLRRRFDLASAGQTETQRILVLLLAGVKTGLMVDGVSEVAKLPVSAIQPAPEISSEQMRIIGRVANLADQGRMILLVDPARLLDKVEADLLATFGASGSGRKPKVL